MGAWVVSLDLIWFVQLISLLGVRAEDTCVRKPGQGYCMCTTTRDNIVVDLSQIRNNLTPKPGDNEPTFSNVPVVAGFSGKYIYSYSPCKSFTETGHDCKNVVVCQVSRNHKLKYGAGMLNSAVFAGDYFKGELRVNYADDNRNSTVFLKCSPNEVGKLEPRGEKETMHYEFVLYTKYVCLHHSHGISTGSILLILFFVTVFVYLVGGILLKHFVQGARGWEQIPNITFWKDFPSLVRDGTMFIIDLCRPKRTYEAI